MAVGVLSSCVEEKTVRTATMARSAGQQRSHGVGLTIEEGDPYTGLMTLLQPLAFILGRQTEERDPLDGFVVSLVSRPRGSSGHGRHLSIVWWVVFTTTEGGGGECPGKRLANVSREQGSLLLGGSLGKLRICLTSPRGR